MSDESVTVETATPAAPANVLSSLTGEQRDAWLKTGELPTPESAPDDSTAEIEPPPADVTAPVEAAPEPVTTGKPRTDMKARLGQQTERAKAAESRAEKAERELAEWKAGRVTPPVEPAAPTTTTPTHLQLVKRYQSDPDWPTLEQAVAEGFEDPYGATMAAQSAFIQQRQTAEREHATAEQAQRGRAQQRIDQAFVEARKIDGFNEAALDYPVPPAMAECIFESDLSGQLLNYFSGHPAEGRALAAMEPLAAARAIGKLEAQLSVVTSTPATPTKTVSSAPDPSLTLGARHTTSTDEVEAAIQSNDVDRYIRLQNERDLKEMKGGRR